ncbi:MAG: hypothetical protein ACAH82_08665 [Solirubrobacteraceae bacterium]
MPRSPKKPAIRQLPAARKPLPPQVRKAVNRPAPHRPLPSRHSGFRG